MKVGEGSFLSRGEGPSGINRCLSLGSRHPVPKVPVIEVTEPVTPPVSLDKL